jgi:hypothetical protein
LEVPCRDHLVEQRARKGLVAVEVARHLAQHVPFLAEVLHELAGQLSRVPLDAAGPGDAEVLDAREEVVQPVSELVDLTRSTHSRGVRATGACAAWIDARRDTARAQAPSPGGSRKRPSTPSPPSVSIGPCRLDSGTTRFAHCLSSIRGPRHRTSAPTGQFREAGLAKWSEIS